jgi:hypothetical protein
MHGPCQAWVHKLPCVSATFENTCDIQLLPGGPITHPAVYSPAPIIRTSTGCLWSTILQLRTVQP